MHNKLRKLHTFIFILLLQNVLAFTPFVRNFSKSTYQAASQNWSIGQDSNGVIYVGNHYGLLRYTGSKWQLYPLREGMQKPVRSLLVADERIYVGSLGEFGYFAKTEMGEMCYTSLSDSLPAKSHSQIWSIVKYNNSIIFQHFGGYFVYDGECLNQFPLNERLQMLHTVDKSIYTILGNNIVHYDGGLFQPVVTTKPMSESFITGGIVARNSKELLLITEEKGILQLDENKLSRWDIAMANEIRNAKPNKCLLTFDSLIIIGTILNGVYALDLNGNLHWHINTENGLPNNTILNLYCDKNNDIWVALDDGVAMIQHANMIQTQKFEKNIGFIYDIASIADTYYVATNQGLFELDQSFRNPHLVPNTSGYILSLDRMNNGSLLIGHSKRTMLIDKNKNLQTISRSAAGGMSVKPIDHSRNMVMQSSYMSLSIYEEQAGGWKFRNRIPGLNIPIQSFELERKADAYTAWCAHSSTGLFKLKINSHLRKIEEQHYYPVLNKEFKHSKITVARVAQDLLFLDGKSIYTYSEEMDSFALSSTWNSQLGEYAKATRVVHVSKSRYWFINPQGAALVSVKDKNIAILNSLNYASFGLTMLDDFENIVPISNTHSLLCFQNGLMRIPHTKAIAHKKTSAPTHLQCLKVTAYNSEGNTRKMSINSTPLESLPYAFNNLFFSVDYACFDQKFTIQYCIKSLSSNWIEMSELGNIDLTRLPSGKHTIGFRIVDDLGKENTRINYQFEILPPYYASSTAFALYVLILVTIGWLIYFMAKRRIEKKEAELRKEQELHIIHLENEKLSNELVYKSKEVTATTMHIIQKKELLQTLQKELTMQKEELGDKYPRPYYNRMMSIIEHNSMSDEEWNIFQVNFDLIHQSFFRNLRLQHPSLSAQDLKLCALLRLNLDTKQIANMLNITIRGVETRRYRLRKKMDLDSETGLTEFLVDFR